MDCSAKRATLKEEVAMINIAVNCLSRRNKLPYKSPNLGDNIHYANFAYQLHKKTGEKVILHFGIEKKSERRWPEIISLFPENSIGYKFYKKGNMSDNNWVDWLANEAAVENPLIFAYRNPLTNEVHKIKHDLVFDDYLSLNSLLPAFEECAADFKKPEKYIIVQWDATWVKRRLEESQIEEIENYYKERGYDIVPVGGLSELTCLKESLKHIGYAISNADYYVGINSGMWHMAQLYLPYQRISCHTQSRHVNAKDDHVNRFINWGGKYNEYFD